MHTNIPEFKKYLINFVVKIKRKWVFFRTSQQNKPRDTK